MLSVRRCVGFATVVLMSLVVGTGIARAQVTPFHHGIAANGYERAEDVTSTPGGGFVTAGSYWSPTFAEERMLVTRHAADGSLLWARTIGSGGFDRATSVAIMSTGDVVVAGLSESGPTEMRLAVVRLSPAGDLVWARFYPHGGGCLDCAENPTILTLGNQFAIVHETSNGLGGGKRGSVGPGPAIAGAVLRINADGSIISHYAFSPDVPGDGLAFNDVAFDPKVNGGGLAIVGTATAMSNHNGYQTADVFFGRYALATDTLILAKRYDRVGGFIKQASSFEYGRGIDVQALIPARGPAGARVLVTARTSGFSAYDAALSLFLDDSGSIQWIRLKDGIAPEVGSARWDIFYNAVIAGNYYFGDGGRLARLLSYSENGDERFFRTYDPASSSGFFALTIRNLFAFTNSSYLAAGDTYNFLSGSDVLLTHTALDGSVGCRDTLEPQGSATPTIEVFNVATLRTPLPGSAAWNPPVAALAGTDVVHCVPVTCLIDLDDGTMTGTPDGAVDINDLLYFFACFEAGDPCGDLDDDGLDPPNPDGGTDINDLLFFLMHFEQGC